jgi:hypothetical protein
MHRRVCLAPQISLELNHAIALPKATPPKGAFETRRHTRLPPRISLELEHSIALTKATSKGAVETRRHVWLPPQISRGASRGAAQFLAGISSLTPLVAKRLID